MDVAAAVLVSLIVLATVVFTLWLFVWAARKDGSEDLAVQRKLGIRRRTRLGR